MLQINLTVLATAHAVSEGIVRGVNAEVQRNNMPNAYTAAGQRAAPSPRQVETARGEPLALSAAIIATIFDQTLALSSARNSSRFLTAH